MKSFQLRSSHSRLWLSCPALVAIKETPGVPGLKKGGELGATYCKSRMVKGLSQNWKSGVGWLSTTRAT